MTDDANGMHAAVAAGVLAAENDFADLLRSVVEVARAIFGARASSILLFDEETDELVFAAVAGAGEQDLVGRRMPSDTGIAGWVLSSRTPLVLEDVANDPRFAREVAEKTGFVPSGMMAAPLLADERALGVLQVLDRPKRSRFSLQEMELLGLFANQAAIALSLLDSTRRARAALDGVGDISVVARLAASLTRLEGEPARDRPGPAPAARAPAALSLDGSANVPHERRVRGRQVTTASATHRVRSVWTPHNVLLALRRELCVDSTRSRGRSGWSGVLFAEMRRRTLFSGNLPSNEREGLQALPFAALVCQPSALVGLDVRLYVVAVVVIRPLQLYVGLDLVLALVRAPSSALTRLDVSLDLFAGPRRRGPCTSLSSDM